MAQVMKLANVTELTENDDAEIIEKLQMSASKSSSSDDNLQENGEVESEEEAPKPRVRRRIQKISDSDSDNEVTQKSNKFGSPELTHINSESDSDVPFKSIPLKSRIRKPSERSSSDSDISKSDQAVKKSHWEATIGGHSENNAPITSIPQKSRMQDVSNRSSTDSDQAVKYEETQKRMKNKRNKLKDRFKSLISSRGEEHAPARDGKELTKSSGDSEHIDEDSAFEKIKQKIKERMSYKPSICDPDTSDDDSQSNQQKSMPKQQKERRTKLTSPKPQRMSAKQAMENMQKIKSESNRMLREKEVSLPYHRPKALSLKDIMSRRKPAVSSDGKCLPIKMNGEQLKQYAQMLEDRQKQMMELWQSDTDEENDDRNSDDEKSGEKATIDGDKRPETEVRSVDESKEVESVSENNKDLNMHLIAADNDKLFDDIFSNSIIEENKTKVSKENENNQVESANDDNVTEDQNSETNMKLVFNDSETSITEDKQDTDNVEEDTVIVIVENSVNKTADNKQLVSECAKVNTESDSQLISLHYDSEKPDTLTETALTEYRSNTEATEANTEKTLDGIQNIDKNTETMDVDNDFSDDDIMNIEDIDNIIENAEIIRDFEDKVNSQVLIRDRPLNLNPKLTGAPGMVIDLDDSDTLPKKSGVELLKERFTFFAKLKTPEELERAKERQIKPGNQHSRLKHELEEQMAEQRSLEWTKRLEDEKQQQQELKELRGEDSDDDNDIDKLEAKLEEGNKENEAAGSGGESEEEEELLENDVEMNDKPRSKNPMLENEAEESDCDDEKGNKVQLSEDDESYQGDAEIHNGDDDENSDEESSEDSESSESEEEQPTAKKGRILKAFEDSDDEDMKAEAKETKSVGSVDLLGTQMISQDDILVLAQRDKSVSEDLFTIQGSSLLVSQKAKSRVVPENLESDADLGTQTFSILDSTKNATAEFLNSSMSSSDKLNVVCETQPYEENLNAIAGMCSGSFSQSLPPLPITQLSQSQIIGEDILALCTGKFYDNQFISQVEDNIQTPLGASQEFDTQISDERSQTVYDNSQTLNYICELKGVVATPQNKQDKAIETQINEKINYKVIDTIQENANKEETAIELNNKDRQSPKVDDNLKSILEELDDPEFDTPKPNRFFCGAKTQTQADNSLKEQEVTKKKFIIESDDDTNDVNASETKKRKKLKKKKPEKRALQISDDEEEFSEEEEADEYESEIEEENAERLVEYDSEENEIEVKPQNEKPLKKKRKGTEFFEQEAELTSEDEWAGSGDEDEAGLDRMEREAGDDESFHQGRLQRELGQIHMRDVLDQDKREVRIIQELLFEDGDLGAGGRQRKFKWKNLDGDEEVGTGEDEFRDTQEEEFESEEQWRKQRHERETFLRQMQNNGDIDDSLNVSINRTSIIKANLMSKTMSMLLEENQSPATTNHSPVELEKKTKDIPSPNKPFSLLQQNYQGSILNRGKGALARLAALATPLAVDDDAPKGKSAATSNRRNFVFATLTPEAPKVTKRKLVTNPGTPALVKKMKTEEKQNMSKSRLLDHMKM